MRRYAKSLWSTNPSPTDTLLYLPFWDRGLHSAAFKSIDSFVHEITATGVVPSDKGGIMNGDDYYDMAAAINTVKDLTVGTIIVWAKITDPTSGFNAMFSFSDTGDASSDLAFQVTVSDFRIRIRENAATRIDLRSPGTAISAATWYMYSFVVDTNSNFMYLDKSAQTPDYAVGDATTQHFFNSVNTPDSCKSGINEDSTGLEWGVTGTIGLAYVSSRSLSAGELSNFFDGTRSPFK